MKPATKQVNGINDCSFFFENLHDRVIPLVELLGVGHNNLLLAGINLRARSGEPGRKSDDSGFVELTPH
jgi:hypothetical protein